MATQPAEGNVLLDVAGAADYLGVSEAFVRRLVLERRVRYYKVGKFVRFRPVDLDAFVEAGRRDPVEPWVPARSPLGRGTGRASAQATGTARRRSSASTQPMRAKTR
jgi:excisionase family DNA binding protein